ncbi:unnamed protein product [Dicrocoelium dendriticum]|nr:unnamed protein product [Dicrocoelium dendriticum]
MSSLSACATVTHGLPRLQVMFLLSITVLNLFLLLYIALPIVLGRFPKVYHSFIFKPRDRWGHKEEHFSCFESLRLSSLSARNFYLETADTHDRIGVWHILPYENQVDSNTAPPSCATFEKALMNGSPIFIYFHGNTKTRAVPWRIDIYKLLSSLGYNVIAFDYRGYGDSSGKMTGERDCVHDSLAVLKYVYERCGSSPVFFWGHSLGTGVVGSLVQFLLHEADRSSPNFHLPRGLILDAPFTNIAQVMMSRRPFWIHRLLPPINKRMTLLTSSLRVEFNTVDNLSGCPVPILILHAKDDRLVPFRLGEQLAASLKKLSSVTFVPFETVRHLGHNFIHTAPEMPNIIRRFVQESITGVSNN